MLLTRTVTKKVLETIVHETFSKFGKLSSSSLLDSLKLLGFYYATTAGISINIEDLKTPNVKKNFLDNANLEIDEISQQWQQGFVSDTERFQSIIDSWNVATESLKNKIVDYYQNFDPANNLYIMAFSGARGNMSQVRQLVGMRGLMSDQEGNIIDLPIQANFREGLSSIDYIISSYGARKGIVDTALKTADSGYLTRRLIYVAQDLVIREFDCKTTEGVLIELQTNSDIKNISGRELINTFQQNKKINLFDKQILTPKILTKLKEKAPIILNIRSPLTCKSKQSICQKCYGWDLAQEKLISLGETVGIIAAQSIGEPGTQLTMRTFHTGGIFTGELLKQINAPFSGTLNIPDKLKTVAYRTNHGKIVLKLQQEVTVSITSWNGITQNIFLEIGSFLYVEESKFIKKGEVIAEFSTQSLIPGIRKLKPIYTPLAGEIRFENLLVRKMLRDNRTIKVNEDDGILWIASGQIFSLPKEVKYLFPSILKREKTFAKIKLSSPLSGIVEFTNNVIKIHNKQKTLIINLETLSKQYKNCKNQFFPLINNYQYIDEQTILGYFEISSKIEGKIYSSRKKQSKYIETFFLVTESDVWKVYSDQINNFSFFQNKRSVVRTNMLINSNSSFSKSGFFIKKDGVRMIFQNAIPIFLSRGTILNYKQGDFVMQNKVFAMLVNFTQQTEDIVQGLPKIEELVEARRPKNKAFLAKRPGIILNHLFNNEGNRDNFQYSLKNQVINSIFQDNKENIGFNLTRLRRKNDKQFVHLTHSVYLNKNLVLYNDQLFKLQIIPSIFEPINKLNKKNEFLFKNKNNEILITHGKPTFSVWSKILNFENYHDTIHLLKRNELLTWLQLSDFTELQLYKNKKNDLIIELRKNTYILLENLNPIQEYEIPLTSKVLFKPGSFIDIAEPITEGLIDIHELLNILFKYHEILDGTLNGTMRSLNKFQILLVNSIQSIYQSQGVNVSSKHIEIVVRQMTRKISIQDGGDTPFLPGEIINLAFIQEVYKTLKNNPGKYKLPKFEPLLMSSTNSSLAKDGFLSAAGFQETKKVLTRSAIEGSSDWLRGLKECLILGRLIPAGSAFLNYKNYLDTVYLFKN